MRHFDGAIEQTPKHFISLAYNQIAPFLNSHAATVNYIVPSLPSLNEHEKSPNAEDRIFYTNSSIWEAIIHERIRRTDINIILDGFFLFEWIARSPGLFHTSRGRMARHEAQRNIGSMQDGVITYNPQGKASKLEGGVGNVRLRPIEIKSQGYYLMSASSSGVCHEGFPVAMPVDLYNKCIEEITDRGAVVRKLVGKLRFIPDELAVLYRGYRDVPQLYLHIDGVGQIKHPQSRHMEELRVSVAVSFLSEYEGFKNIYATYVHFDPSDRDSFRQSVDWMEQDYVIEKYKGQVITDFDQQESHFATAPFSLEKVMNLGLVEGEVRRLGSMLNINTEGVIEHQTEVYKTIIYNNYGQVGAMGDNAHAHDMTFNQTVNNTGESLDLVALATELAQLRMAIMAKQDTSIQASKAIGVLADAEEAAKANDQSKTMKYLKAAGEWTLNFAKETGKEVLAEAIKKSMGMM
jgi:hypothetical protein